MQKSSWLKLLIKTAFCDANPPITNNLCADAEGL